MGLDDDEGCDHDWQLVELHPDSSALVPALDRLWQCVVCDAEAYDAVRRVNRPPLTGAV